MKKLTLLSLTLFSLFFINTGWAYLFPGYQGGWVNVGLGGGAGSSISGPAAEISLNYAPSPADLWTLRALSVANLSDIFSETTCSIVSNNPQDFQKCNNDDHNLNEYGLMFGLMKKNSVGYISGSTGIAAVDVTTPEITVTTSHPNAPSTTTILQNAQNNYTVGVPLEIQAFWTPFKYAGLGIIGFGDMNTKKSFGGAMLALQLGLLKA